MISQHFLNGFYLVTRREDSYMIKRISITDLIPGMFIVDVTNSWSMQLDLEKKIFVEDENLINKLRKKGFKEIYIDTSKHKEVKTKSIETSIPEIEEPNLQQELQNAASVRSETYKAVMSVMTDYIRSQEVNLGKVEKIVSTVTDSILQNKYIIAGLGLMHTTNNYLFEHSVNSLTLMVAFANSMGYDREMQEELGVGALLHDIGMLKIPSVVLNKRSEFTPRDIIEMKKHVEYGYNILKNTPGIPESALIMACQHHERFSGTGYPLRLVGNKINIYGQMAGIIDVYHAATTDKGYKKGIPPSKALANILSKKTGEFDRELVKKFVQAIGIYPFGSLLSLENGLAGIVVNMDENDLLHPTLRIIYNPKKGGLITPYDIYPHNYIKDISFKIKGVKPIENLMLRKPDINKILGIQF